MVAHVTTLLYCVSELTVPLFVTLLHKMTEQVSSQYLFIKGIVMLCFITVYIKFPCYNRVGNGGRKLLLYKESYAYKKTQFISMMVFPSYF